MTENETFTFFYGAKSPLSQHHVTQFTLTGLFQLNSSDNVAHQFSHCEQWMMYNKALLFKDEKMAGEILRNSDPKMCKKFGRKVANFDDKIWKQNREKIVYEGNKAKFTQNKNLLQELLGTKGTTLVEASPRDRVWGIGMSASNHKAKDRATWCGSNLLGQILTQLRDELELAQSHNKNDQPSVTEQGQSTKQEEKICQPKRRKRQNDNSKIVDDPKKKKLTP